MVALPEHREHAPGAPVPAPLPPKREPHLRLVERPQQAQDDRASRVARETRWTAALVAVATLALIVLWAAAARGAADEAWWGPIVGVVFAGVVAFGVLVIRQTR